ncbi:MAG: hypothetical protein ACI9QD_001020 [Thermoproteota archaeon]|jgi:hypothetical protein
MIKKLLLLSLLLLAVTFNVYAQVEVGTFCDLNSPAVDVKIPLKVPPEYFFKPVPESEKSKSRDEVSLIMGSSNFMLSMETGELTSIPGPYDGVPTPDGEFIVSPANGQHITFYDRDDLESSSTDIYDDLKSAGIPDQNTGAPLMGVYHSLGVISDKNDLDGNRNITYRAITDTETNNELEENSLMYKEYTFEIDKQTGAKSNIGTNGDAKPLCSNMMDQRVKTPIISKDGSMLSAYSVSTGTTIIYNIEKDASGNSVCNIKKDMGIATSKMEFSPKGDKVVFAMNSLPTTNSDVSWYKQPPLDYNMNVFVYDLKSDEISKVTSQDEGNAYYPSFSNNGEDVVWLSQEFGNNDYPDYSVKRTKLKNAKKKNYIDFSALKNCEPIPPLDLSSMAIGKLWENICAKFSEQMTMASASIIPMSLEPNQCRYLVLKYWDKFIEAIKKDEIEINSDKGEDNEMISSLGKKFYKQQFLGLDKEQLENDCEVLANKGNKTKDIKVIETNNDNVEFIPDDPIRHCTQCHASGTNNYIPFDKPEELGPWKKKILLSLITGVMPKNMSITQDERDELIEKFRAMED